MNSTLKSTYILIIWNIDCRQVKVDKVKLKTTNN
jgi:hypothetical protein